MSDMKSPSGRNIDAATASPVAERRPKKSATEMKPMQEEVSHDVCIVLF